MAKYTTKAQKRKAANASKLKYQLEHTKMMTLKLRIEEDKDILEKLDSVPNKIDYIRQLIRADISKGE